MSVLMKRCEQLMIIHLATRDDYVFASILDRDAASLMHDREVAGPKVTAPECLLRSFRVVEILQQISAWTLS